MRHVISAMTLLATALLALPALAQEPEDRGGDPPRRQPRERILRAFDQDGDGRLNDQERDAMREQMGERFEAMRQRMPNLFEERGDVRADEDRDRPPRRGAEGDRGREGRRGPDADRGRDSDRDAPPGPRGESRRGPVGERRVEERRIERRRGRDADRPREREAGPQGPRGPIGRSPERNLQALFGWFDDDGDNMLSRREFAELTQFVQRRRPGPPGGPRLGVRGLDGPPRGERENFFRLRSRFDGPPRDELRSRRERDERRPERRRLEEPRRLRGDPPRPPRPEDPPGSPPSPERNPSDPV